MKKAMFNIKSSQEIDGQTDTMEFMCIGSFSISDKLTVLEYDESVSIGIEGVKTTLKLDDKGIVTLERSGGKYGNLVVEEGKRHLCQYTTEFGDIMIGIYGESVKNNISLNGGNLSLQYSIDINSGLLSKNKVEISVREEV